MRFKQVARLLVLAVVGLAGCGRDALNTESPEMRRGYRLVYEVHWDSEPPSADSKEELVQATKDRLESLNFPSEVRLLDDSRLEVKIPTPKKEALGIIRQVLPRKGQLELRIVARSDSHDYIIDASLDSKNEANNVVHESSKPESPDSRAAIGKWVRIGRVAKPVEGELSLRLQPDDAPIRDAKTKQLIELEPSLRYGEALEVARWLRAQGHEEVEILVSIDDGYDIQNQHVKTTRTSIDARGNPSIAFEMNELGAKLLASFTNEHEPEGDRRHRVAIIVDDEVISAPNIISTISDRGEITGLFTDEETKELACLLGAKPLPGRLSPKPLEEHFFEDN